eukprot:13336-Heterococcus_DN1.PRE.1
MNGTARAVSAACRCLNLTLIAMTYVPSRSLQSGNISYLKYDHRDDVRCRRHLVPCQYHRWLSILNILPAAVANVPQSKCCSSTEQQGVTQLQISTACSA